jgi:hypothetical protein
VIHRSIMALLFIVAAVLGACTSPSGGGGATAAPGVSAAPAASAPAASAPASAEPTSGGY